MTNSNPPKGARAVPAEVGEALANLIRTAAKHGVPFSDMIENPDAGARRRLQAEVSEKNDELRGAYRKIQQQTATIRRLEKKLGLDEEL